jgi:hypothetical protein
MKNFLLSKKKIILGTALGALAGFAYYYFVGCSSGSCAITSKPLNSTLYGALMGLILFANNSSKNNTENNESVK